VASILHSLDTSSHVVIGPDNGINAPFSNVVGWGGVILSWDNNNWRSVVPGLHK